MRFVPGAVLACFALAHAALAAPAPWPPLRPPTLGAGPARAPEPGVVLVALKPGAALETRSDGSLRARDANLAVALERFHLVSAKRLSRAPASGRPTYLELRSDAADFDPRAAAAALRANPAVLAASPNLHVQLQLVPNDTYLAKQWSLGTSAAAVRARPAWDRETGNPNVTIGIMDTGVDLGHPDFTGKIWTNPGEIPGNGIDDDHNGYIDDVHGWDFGEDDADPNPEPFYDPIFGIDESWHGTFVAGIAGAATNNAVGIAGVAWGCKIVPLKVADANSDMPLSAIAAAFDYAITMHVSVLNMSIGVEDSAAFFQVLVNDAFNGGVVCVAAAGNDGTDTPIYPAGCDSVLAVAATNQSNNRSSFSNWGDYVDIAAPGETMFSGIARNYVYDDFTLSILEYYGYDDVNPYVFGDGTSFSTPIVSGAAALVRSKFPGLTPWQVMRQLVLNGDVRLYDNPIGPRLNLDRALANPLAVDPAVASARGLALAPPFPNPVRASARMTFVLPREGFVRLAILDTQGRNVRTLVSGTLAAGEQRLDWDVRDESGAPVAPGLYFAQLTANGSSASRRLAVAR